MGHFGTPGEVRADVVREIRTLRAKWRELETELRTLLNGHEGALPGSFL